MCGIAALVKIAGWNMEAPPWEGGEQAAQDAELPTASQLAESVRSRGPDRLQTVQAQDGLWLIASTLCLRGPPTPQPVMDEAGNMLLFNGQLFGDEAIAHDENDTLALLDRLSNGEGDHVEAVIDSLRGPWSLIYFQRQKQRLWFARDVLGRRSLQVSISPKEGIAISSHIPENFSPQDVPPFGLCYMNLSEDKPTVCTRWRDLKKLQVKAVPGGPREPLTTVSALPERMQRRARRRSSDDDDDATRTLQRALELAVRRRLVGLGYNAQAKPELAQVAVLFSGGIDSMVVACFTSLLLPSFCTIDLINVSFGLSPQFASPDRETALISLTELRRRFPLRNWQLVSVNVTPEEIDLHRSHITSLQAPASTPMDKSIATALWFAARGRGHLTRLNPRDCKSALYEEDIYETPARVLLSGLGADEQLAGYKGRHRTVFARGGEEALNAELEADMARLWWRNLGRDDRVISDHGREVRFPFLDEDVVACVADIPTREIADLTLDDGVGDKMILRKIARNLELSEESCTREKRALQFGSRSKKYVETEKGSNVVGSRRYKRLQTKSAAK
mmetsp:Transcript_11209/g.34314  ORF Transcript_11209/g.34314 Transcript_11209/m.34314 type:complete len:564 (+) Transcript_11209:120-1811(+)